MKTKYFRQNDKVLLVGEGNFSFAVSLIELHLNVQVTATCYESSVVFESGIRNIDYLINNGVRVKLGIDATKLEDHFDPKLENFDVVVFNFPHVGGKMRIERNRNLLKDFFKSVKNFVSSNFGVVLVSLCDGQGGTSFDKRQRRRDDSWQIEEMAAHGNFLITQVEPFYFENFHRYNCIGYRGLEKAFVNSDASVHVLRKTDFLPDAVNIAVRDLDILRSFKKENEGTSRSNWEEVIAKFHAFESRDETISNSMFKRRRQLVDAIVSTNFYFHITFTVDDHFDEFQFYSTLYCLAGNVIKGVKFLSEYAFPDTQKITRTYEINYGSFNIPLYRSRVVDIHRNLVVKIIEDCLNVVVTK